MASPLVTRLLPYRVRHGVRRLQAHYDVQRRQARLDKQLNDLQQLWMKTGFKWSVDQLLIDDNEIEIGGWAYVPPADRGRVGFTWNDRAFDRVEYGLPGPDLAEAIPFIDGITASGFRCRSRLPANWPQTGNHLTFRCVDRETGRSLVATNQPYCFQIPAADEVLPEPNRRVRVMGWPQEMSFRIGGYTIFNQLRRALAQTVGRDITQFDQVLDWGCGCGRVSRYFQPPGAFTGLDVDPDNVRWCQQHLPHGKFQTIPLYPPTTLPAETFDLVFGISVMTHLRESTQDRWLQELHRITRPGGIVLLTFHGEASTCLANPPREVWDQLSTGGFVDTSNTVYDAALPENGYYRNIYQTTDYIRRSWTRYFQVLDTLPCFIFHQDMAILRKA